MVGPLDGCETGLPARDRDVADVATADDDAGTRPEQRDQSEEVDVVGHLVNHAGSRGRGQVFQPVEVPSGRDSRRGRAEGIQRGEWIVQGPADHLRQALEDVLHIRQLAGAMDLGMRGEDLFNQGRSRAWQADDEDRPGIGVAPMAASGEEFGVNAAMSRSMKPDVGRGYRSGPAAQAEDCRALATVSNGTAPE